MRHLHSRGFWAFLAAIPLLAACGGAPIIYRSYYSSAYYPGHVELAATSGDVLVLIRNNPFTSDPNNAAVIAAMQERNLGPRLRLSQVPRVDDKYGYKVVVDFRSASINYGDLCRSQPDSRAQRPAGEDIRAAAAFCVGDLLLSDAAGAVSASEPTDPRFRRLMADIMTALTAPYNPGDSSRPDPR